MTTTAQARDLLFGIVRTALPTTRVLLEDEDEPTLVDDSAGVKPFVRAVLRYAGGTPAALGGRFWRASGVMILSVFTPQGEGTLVSDGLCDTLLAALRTADLAGVRIIDPGMNTVGPDGPWHHAQVTASFEIDHTTS